MATNDHSEAPGAEDPPAKNLTDDVKRLLDQLAGQITDADQRHTDSLQDMQERLGALSDRAAAAKPEVPDDSAEAFARVETAMAALAGRLADAEQNAPPADSAADEAITVLPEDVRASLRRAIANGHREAQTAKSAWSEAASEALAQHRERGPAAAAPAAALSETPLAARYPYVGPHSGANAPAQSAAPAIERAWLEERFADIADRVETSMARLDRHNSFETIAARFDQLEQRFAVALDGAPGHVGPDAGSLRGLEKQITGLFAELDRTQVQLGRLDTIESRLTELRSDPSDDHLTRLIRAASPTDAQLSAVAMAAAECVAERIRGAASAGASAPAGAAPLGAAMLSPVADPRLGELTALMQEFIGDHRLGDAQTAEALDTMQQAMQHLIDRVEAIEAAQITGHDELMRATQVQHAGRTDGQHERLDFGFREQDLTPRAIGTDELPRLAVIGPGTHHSESQLGPQAVPEATPQTPSGDSHPEPRREPSAPDHEDNTRHATAMPDNRVQASATTSAHRAPPPASPSTGEPHRDAFIAMARRAAEKAAREPSPEAGAAASDKPAGVLGWARQLAGSRSANGAASPARRPRLLLVASFAAFLLAGFWMLAGSGLRGIIPGIGSLIPASSTPSTGMNGAAPADDAPDHLAPASQGPRKNRFPGMGRVVDGGVGITIDEGPAPSGPAAPLKARDEVQLASLSTRTALQEAQTTTAAAPETTARLASAMYRSVEMPSVMIGPLSLRTAAAKGDPSAQFEVASRFAEAKGVPQDFAKAATWYQRAAAQGHANAQYRLGALYERGLGVAADPARARVWYGRAAEQGNVRAMHNLAVFSAGRPGTSPDYPSAVQWFTEAADRGLADSQYNLGILYESGLGVPASMVEAYKWYALAARSGDKDAGRRRDALRMKLDARNVSAADALVIRWRAKPLEPAANGTRVPGLAAR
jgi:localization factor PodJL